MKRTVNMLCSCLIVGIFVVMALGCSSVKGWHKGQADWMRVQIHENFNYDKAFATALDLLTEKYEMEMINKDGGYARTAWNYYRKTNGRYDDKARVRVTLKFNHDRTQLSIKTEVQKMINKMWVDGYSDIIGRQTRDDIQGVLQ
ncbi:MAG: hypothetical protein IKO66_00835 [Paludibacteraceae bacterium]|nr:hypothetical protein [Paludibacteraceae bacterium]